MSETPLILPTVEKEVLPNAPEASADSLLQVREGIHRDIDNVYVAADILEGLLDMSFDNPHGFGVVSFASLLSRIATEADIALLKRAGDRLEITDFQPELGKVVVTAYDDLNKRSFDLRFSK